MKAIKDCKWLISITHSLRDIRYFYWQLTIDENIGVNFDVHSIGDFYGKDNAIKDFEQFAKLNGITKYKFI